MNLTQNITCLANWWRAEGQQIVEFGEWALGAFLGALLLGIVFDGFNLNGVSANAFNVVLGAAILLAMVLNVTLIVVRKRLGSREPT